jgi:di/tricarboxylate transporter
VSWQEWLTIAVILGMVIILVRDVAAPSVAVLGATVVLFVTGVINGWQALSGFSNPAPITIAALFVLARAVGKTGALQPMVWGVLGKRQSKRSTLGRLLLPTTTASAFLSNTPIVAMLVPQVSEWADRRGISPSRFLMPLSFAAVFGGAVTLIGTATNLVISGLLEASGHQPLGLFEFTPFGLPLALGGILLTILLAPAVLPERRPARQELEEGMREYVVNMEVVREGPLDGRKVEEGGLRHLQGVYLVEILRDGELIGPVPPTTTLHGGDHLTFVGVADRVVDLQSMQGLVSTEREHLSEFDTNRHTFYEVVIGAASPLVGKTLRQASFRATYQAAVVAIHRAGSRVKAKLGDVHLHVGDTLVLLTDPGFGRRWRDRRNFLLVSRLGGTPPSATGKSWLVGLVTAGIVIPAATGLLTIVQSALLGGFALVFLGILTPAEARDSIDLDVVILIAAAFGLGAAVESSGLAHRFGHGLIQLLGGWGPTGALLGITLAAVLLRELVTNKAAAVLLFPVAMSTAVEFGVDPRPFAIALAVVVATSFLTPIGYQTNTMVYGPGGYRFGDYLRLGLPLTLYVIVAVVLFVPLLFPFQ